MTDLLQLITLQKQYAKSRDDKEKDLLWGKINDLITKIYARK